MGKLEGSQLDDEVVETDTLKYTISSTTGLVLLLRITTKKPALGQRSPVSAEFFDDFVLPNFLLPLISVYFEKRKR